MLNLSCFFLLDAHRSLPTFEYYTFFGLRGSEVRTRGSFCTRSRTNSGEGIIWRAFSSIVNGRRAGKYDSDPLFEILDELILCMAAAEHPTAPAPIDA